ncbi:DUF6193 family natural product biosynthesis protein [Streptomyces rubellomurinus]|uniref:Uncharacterized protein n=1 Tax=Streptomyces rubellomurinus (strain ATCC 31215) TaxID=359131 RepID=A0A0F2TGZ8_STRR3|nr:DUF6193 family natural product biosynthesis protein [Streptomyces rubellomurinus]KJS61841.1 hypothetical protein VM95_12670 [Streptomyces rubellomurinus]
MSEAPDPAVLYPEIARHGSLAAALRALAAEQGLVLDAEAHDGDPLRRAAAASVLPHREAVAVSGWVHERRWWVSAWATNGMVLSGVTDELGQVPAVMAAWARGASVDEIGRIAGFDVLTGRFEVPDGNAVDVIAAEWQYRLKEARDTDWPEHLALVEAAYAEPRLRRFYPFTSHWALRFSRLPRPFVPSFATLSAPKGGGTFRVSEWGAEGSAETRVATAAEAVAIAVDRITAEFEAAG